MFSQHRHNQQGYLLIVAVVLIVIVGLIGSLLAYMFAGSSSANANIAQSNTAFYIATSGLEIAKRDIVINRTQCTAINGSASYTNAPIFSGQFTVTGTIGNSSSSLNGSVSASATSITLANAAGFSSSGFVWIENELISYQGISGNALQNVSRGQQGTFAVSHGNGVSAIQNHCLLTAIGATPTIAAPEGKRVLQQILPGTASFSFDGVMPTLASAGGVQLAGNPFIVNPTVTSNSSNFPGSTIVSRGSVQIAGVGGTKVNSIDNSGLVVSSTMGSISNDVWSSNNQQGKGLPPITAGSLFSYFFNPAYDPSSNADVKITGNVTSLNTLDGITGKTIYVGGTMQIAGIGSATIGSPSSPVILIVNNGIQLAGSPSITIYGFLFVNGVVQMAGTPQLNGNGILATTGLLQMAGSGVLQLDPGIVARLSLINNNMIVTYSAAPTLSQEIFQ